MIQSTKNAVFPKTRLRTSFFVNKHKEAAGLLQCLFTKKPVIKENCVFVLRVMIASFCEMMRSFFSEYRLRFGGFFDADIVLSCPPPEVTSAIFNIIKPFTLQSWIRTLIVEKVVNFNDINENSKLEKDGQDICTIYNLFT